MITAGTSVLVTGATGFTGSVLVQRLCESGCNVRAIARQSSNREALKDLPIDWIVGDVFDDDTIRRAMPSVEYIFHVAAAYRSAGITNETYHRVHVESTQKLCAAALTLAPRLKRFVHFSTVGVHGHIENPPANELAPFGPGDIYQDTKLEAERWIVAFAKDNPLPLTVLRPAAILGPDDERLLKLFKFAKLPMVPIIGKTRGMYHLIHVDDLVAFAIHAASSDETLSEVFICGNEQSTSIREIVSIVATELGRNPRFVRLPAAPIFFAARVCEVLFKTIGIDPPIYPRRVAFFTKDRAFDTAKMNGVKGFKLKHDNESGVIETCRGYQKSGLL